MSSALSLAQRAFYKESGYIVVPHLLQDAQIERYLRRARQIVLGDHAPSAAVHLVRDINFTNGSLPMPEDPELSMWKLLNPDRFDTVMAECLELPQVLDVAGSLLGPDLLAFLLMFIYKPPGVAQSEHPFHQDGAYFHFAPLERGLGVWIPLDLADESNGGLSIIPGSHRLPIRKHSRIDGLNPGCFEADRIEELRTRAISLQMSAGDAIFFDTRLLHRTGGNRTRRHRRVITLHLASAHCRPTGPAIEQFRFRLVRGSTYEGCLQPYEENVIDGTGKH